MFKMIAALLSKSILSDNKGTDALEYVAMAAVIIKPLADVAQSIVGKIQAGESRIQF